MTVDLCTQRESIILTGTLGSAAAFAKLVEAIEQDRTVSVRPSLEKNGTEININKVGKTKT